MGSVQQKFDADGSALEKELAKMQREFDKLLKKVDDVEKKSVQSNKNQESAWDRHTKKIGSAVGSYFSLEAILGAVTRQYEKQLALQDKLHTKTMSIAQSQASVRKNIGDVSTEQFQSFLKSVQGIQGRTGFGDLSQLNAAAADVLSATGSDRGTTLAVLEAAAPIFKDKPEELSQFAGGVADLMSASGSSAKEATALALAGFGNSRTTSLAAFKNVAQAIKSGGSFMDVDGKQGAEEITALFGTLSRFSGDSEGSSTRTATVKLLRKLEEFGGSGSTAERLGRVQAGVASGKIDPEAFIKGFEAQSVGAVRDLLYSDSAIAGDLTKTFQSTRGSGAAYDRLVGDLASGTTQLDAYNREQARAAAGDQRAVSAMGEVRVEREDIRRIYRSALENTTESTIGNFGMDLLTGVRSFTEGTFDNPGLAREYASELQTRGLSVGNGTPAAAADQQVLFNAAAKLEAAAEAIERAQRSNQNPAAAAATHDERG